MHGTRSSRTAYQHTVRYQSPHQSAACKKCFHGLLWKRTERKTAYKRYHGIQAAYCTVMRDVLSLVPQLNRSRGNPRQAGSTQQTTSTLHHGYH